MLRIATCYQVFPLNLLFSVNTSLAGLGAHHIVSEANNPASEASLAKFGAKRQFFASISEDRMVNIYMKVF